MPETPDKTRQDAPGSTISTSADSQHVQESALIVGEIKRGIGGDRGGRGRQEGVEALEVSPAKSRARRWDLARERALEAVRAGGLYEEAAKAAGICTHTLREWRRAPEFAAAFDKAVEEGTDKLEEVLARCATVKVEEHPGYQTSLIFALKNRRPNKWRDRTELELSGGVRLDELDPTEFAREALAAGLSMAEMQQICRPQLTGQTLEGDVVDAEVVEVVEVEQEHTQEDAQ